MDLIPIATVTASDTNIPQLPPAAWNSGTTYADDVQRSISTGDGYNVYQSRQAGNLNHNPASSPDWWYFICKVYSAYSAATAYFYDDIVTDTGSRHLYQFKGGAKHQVTTQNLSVPGTMEWPSHGLAADTKVMFRALPSGVSFSGLTAYTTYYVRNPLTNTFELSATAGGASLTFGGATSAFADIYVAGAAGIALTDVSWTDLGSTNAYAMLDDSIGTYTTCGGGGDGLSYSVEWDGFVNTLNLFGLQASSLTITADGIDDIEVDLIDYGHIEGWWDFFFGGVRYKRDISINLPLLFDVELGMTFNCADEIRVGIAKIGMAEDIGGAVYGAEVGTDDFSRKVQDTFGGWEITPRGYAKWGRYPITIFGDNTEHIQAKTDSTRERLDQFRTTLAVWRGADGYRSTLVLGYFQNLTFKIAGPNHSEYSAEVKGTT